MARLGKRGWNNVIIFSMLIMIALFNGLHKKLFVETTEIKPTTLIAQDQVILSIEFLEYRIERIGNGWRSNFPQVTDKQLEQLIDNWQQQAIAMPTSEFEHSTNTANDVATVWLAGQAKGIVFELYYETSHIYLHQVHRQQWFSIPNLAQHAITLKKPY